MKSIMILAAGSLAAAGAAGFITAAPATADVGCTPKVLCDAIQDQPRTFVNNVATSTQSFTQIISGQAARDQLVVFRDAVVHTPEVAVFGTCEFSTTGYCPGDPAPGLLNLPQVALQNANPVNQLATFAAAINPVTNLNTFVSSVTAPFGPDNGPTSNTPGDEDP